MFRKKKVKILQIGMLTGYDCPCGDAALQGGDFFGDGGDAFFGGA